MRRYGLALILLLGLALRLIHLGGRPLWYDEAFAVLFAEKGLSAMLYGTLTPVAGGAADIHPLLYYTTLNIWMGLFGQSPFTVRLWSVILGVATIAVIYGIGRALFDHRLGLAAALITAIAPFHIQYSQETRMYALLGLLLASATLCFIYGWRDASPANSSTGGRGRLAVWRGWIAFGILSGLAMYTQQLAAFYLVALGLVPLLARRWIIFRGVVMGAVIALVIYSPWLVNLPGQLQKVQSYYWLEPPSIARPLLTLRSFLSVSLDFPPPASMVAFFGALFVTLLVMVQLILSLRQRRTKADRHRLLLVLWLTLFPMMAMWLISQIQPLYLERSLLPSALMAYVVLAWYFTRSGLPRPIASVVGVACLILAGVGLYYQYTWATFPNSPFNTVGEFIRQSWQPGDVVVHQNKLTALPMIYYERDLTQGYIGDRPGSSDDTLALPTQEALRLLADGCVGAAGQGAERIWWVAFAFAEAQYAAAERPEYQQAMDWLTAHYTLASQQTVNDLQITLFTDPRGVPDAECPAT